MNAPESHVAPAVGKLIRLVHKQREAFARERCPSLEVRRDRLERLRALVVDNEEAVVAAICEDFGSRSAHETLLG
jgi:coniferyl-aldehyde dehydrogenase